MATDEGLPVADPDSDQAWFDSLPETAEFVTPSGLRCRPTVPYDDDPSRPDPDHVFVEFWAAGGRWVPLAEVRTWGRLT